MTPFSMEACSNCSFFNCNTFQGDKIEVRPFDEKEQAMQFRIASFVPGRDGNPVDPAG